MTRVSIPVELKIKPQKKMNILGTIITLRKVSTTATEQTES